MSTMWHMFWLSIGQAIIIYNIIHGYCNVIWHNNRATLQYCCEILLSTLQQFKNRSSISSFVLEQPIITMHGFFKKKLKYVIHLYGLW